MPGLVVFAVLLGYLLGGRLRRFEDLRINRWGLAIVGAVLTLIVNLFPALSFGRIPTRSSARSCSRCRTSCSRCS